MTRAVLTTVEHPAPSPAEERRQVHALQAGDPDAARWLVVTHQGLIHALCLRMLGHRQDAEDVTQESLVRALRGIRGFDPERPLRPWLLGIAANRCRTALARRRRLPTAVDSIDEPGVEDAPPPLDHDELRVELQRGLEKLRPDYRLVFTLYHEQELSYDDIARTLGRPLGTIKIWLHRARLELAAHLGRREWI
jgi:RNA polymerase sigma-70 factor (ECF subfamily)